MRCRRADVAGGTSFFTVNLAEWKRTLLMDHVDLLRAVVQMVKAIHRFHVKPCIGATLFRSEPRDIESLAA